MTIMKERVDQPHFAVIGKVAMEKLESIRSKMRDDTATSEDRQNALILEEIVALAGNRITSSANESAQRRGDAVWVEKTSQSHFPHIRLHGGALEDDPVRD
ncbi:MAG: hypothetical protein WCH05_08625 [Chlorobiaceae bacterium]